MTGNVSKNRDGLLTLNFGLPHEEKKTEKQRLAQYRRFVYEVGSLKRQKGKSMDQAVVAAEEKKGADISNVEIVESIPVWDASWATHLFRIAQEAVSNAMKHGKAKHVTISFTSNEGLLRLRVSDDGEGFGKPATADSGMGVNIMRYRARIMGGTLEIKSVPGEGVKVICTIPVRTPSK